MQFGREVRRRRTALRLTLEALAHRAGITPHHLSAIENGKAQPRLDTVLALAKALGRVPPGELLGASNEFTAAAADVARMYDRASPEVQDIVVKVLRLQQRPRR